MSIQTDLSLTRQAIRERWRIPTDTKIKSVKILSDLISDDTEKVEIRLSAIKTLKDLDKLNLDEEKLHTPQNINVHQVSTEELLKQLQNALGNNVVKEIESKLIPRLD